MLEKRFMWEILGLGLDGFGRKVRKIYETFEIK
jgi:hypothetical protein